MSSERREPTVLTFQALARIYRGWQIVAYTGTAIVPDEQRIEMVLRRGEGDELVHRLTTVLQEMGQ